MNKHYEMLVEILKLAASEPEIQIKSLPDFVLATNEIALNFHDVYQYKKELLLINKINTEMAELLDIIDKETEYMTDNKVGWEIEELKKSHHWKRIRGISKKLLSLMGENIGPPNLDCLTYIKGS